MVYLNNIPQPTDNPATQSQAQLLENFSQLDIQFGTAGDHVAFTAGADNGLHKQVRFNGIIADPGLADPRASLYLKTIAGNSELFFENFNVGAAVNVQRQMTNLTITSVGTDRSITTPWGIIIKFGRSFGMVAGQTVTYAGGVFPNNFFSLSIAVESATPTRTVSYIPDAGTAGRTSFTAYSTNNNLFFTYIAIGN